MKKHFLIFLFISIFFFSPILVKADFGDVRYEITDVELDGTKITFIGWAYIHKTNNFQTINKMDGTELISGGDQKVIIRAYAGKDLIATSSNSVSGNKVNYNFYCELYYNGISDCSRSKYNDESFNSCSAFTSGCYYEDIYFEITFDTLAWNVSDENNITFKIAVSNNFFESKLSSYDGEILYDGDYYTKLESISIAYAAIKNNTSNDYIEFSADSVSKQVKFIAEKGVLRDFTNTANTFKGTTYGNYWDNKCNGNRDYTLYLDDLTNYPGGRSKFQYTGACKNFLGESCVGSYFYALQVGSKSGNVACPGSVYVAAAFGTHIKPTSEFKIKVKNDKKCEPVTPSAEDLVCNNSKTYNSTCNELTVHTNEGSANVKIEQTGIVSSVLTPNKIYSGGGFKFGIIYYNTIKWTYAQSIPNNDLHTEVTIVMNDKIKDYNAYISGINIEELKLGGKLFDKMIKKCYTSDENQDYYEKELTVVCLFTLPEPNINLDGGINYNNDESKININNKYYTPMNYVGDYEIKAKIVGMDRVTINSSKDDSNTEGTAWTGDWSDTFENCEINIYPLFMTPKGKSGVYRFIYRPIDLYNPFPNRNAGINWYDWYSDNRNKDNIENSYRDLEYSFNLNNEKISSIKNYNNSKDTEGTGYFNWDDIDTNGESSFVDKYAEKVGDNS